MTASDGAAFRLRPGFFLALPAVGAVLALAACDEEVTEGPFLQETATPVETATSTPAATPTSTPSSTPTPVMVPETGGLEGFRLFAGRIEAALVARDGAFFAERGVETEMTCAGDEQLGPCTEQPAGTVLRGIPGAAWKSDAFALFAPGEFDAMLVDWFSGALPDESDAHGDGAVRLFALALGGGGNGQFLAIATAILDSGPATGVQRQTRILRFQFDGTRWLLDGETFAAVSFTSEDWLSGNSPTCYDREGSPLPCYTDWERWQ